MTLAVSAVPTSLWHQWYAADEDAVPSQSPAWQSAILSSGSYRPASRLYEFDTGRRLICPLVERRLGAVTVARGSWPAGWNYGGLLVDGGGLPSRFEFAAVLEDLRTGAISTRFVPEPRAGAALRDVRPASAIAVPLRTQVLDLRPGVGHSWDSGFSRQSRQSVRRAERVGVEVSRSSSESAISRFGVLYAAAQRRWGLQRGHPSVMTAVKVRMDDPTEQVRQVIRACGDEVTIWEATWRGELVAAHVVLSHGANAHDWLGAIDPLLARKSGGSYLLEAAIIRQAHSEGRRWINLGESDPGGPVEAHKCRLGARAVDYSALQMEAIPVTKAMMRLRRSTAAMLAERGEARRAREISSPSPLGSRGQVPTPAQPGRT